MGAGNVGCCDNNTTHKNSEISVQSVTYREAGEDFLFSPNILSLPRGEYNFALSDQARRIRKLEKLKHSKKLLIYSLASENEILEIHPNGLQNSRRKVPDGYVFFGCKLKEEGQIVNDYKVHIRGSKNSDYIGRCFLIYFKIESKSYWIKDLNKGPGVFIKLDYPLVMKDGMIMNIGNSFLSFRFKNKITSNPEVEIRKLGDINYVVDLSGLDCYNGVIIGRGHNCRVRIKDESLSKQHAMIKFNPASGWILHDGDLSGNASTNGTWLYANEEFEVYEEMFFKTCQTVFKASLSN